MDITTIIGVAGGVAFILYGILSSGEMASFIDMPSIYIVLGGTLCTIIASFPFKTLKGVGKHMMIIVQGKKFDPAPIIDTLVEFAQIARRDGLLALESKAAELKDPFFQKSVMYVVDAVDSDKIRATLEADIENCSLRHSQAMEIYGKGSSTAPAFGMIGTLVGLINMLKNMNLSSGASDTLGPSMSVALVTTFYGCVLANLVFNPIAAKLSLRDEEERLYKEIILEGVLAIQEGDNPKNLRERLVSYLSQKQQAKLLNSDGKENK